MSVSKSFYHLNTHRPTQAGFGEVTSIYLNVYLGDQLGAQFVGRSKRKSVHVPPSSNAYWNHANLRADLVAFCSERGIKRQTRLALYASLRQGVDNIHQRNLRETYSTAFEANATQYFVLDLIVRDEVPGFTVIDGEVREEHNLHIVEECCFTVVM